jgi:NAD(P)-dependent dehydrogenase (short-subunit alcohol dehydrogenase family)
MEIPDDEMEVCLSVLQRIANSYGTVKRSQRFNSLVSKVYREGRRYEQQEADRQAREQDRAAMATTGMVQIQRDAVAAAQLPAPGEGIVRTLNNPETCYICKQPFTEIHFFYHMMCPACAAYNWQMRGLSADLQGRTALVTGGRVKIGHQTVLRLLRDGAKVIVTTRFPHVAARRLHDEPDSAQWADRVRIFGLDLRNIPAVENFARHMLESEASIDILIHNAAQTIRRPKGFYRDLVAMEQNPQAALPSEALRLVVQGAPSTLAISESSDLLPSLLPEGHEPTAGDVLPADSLHDNEERADSRDTNSWMLKLDQVGPQEMLEVQLVNSVAPFLLNSRLKPLLLRAPFERRFIVNVSAMEGQFARNKTVYHPHTNMAKAALNMMTRTSGDDYARDGIYMTSVDTGWVTDEVPGPQRLRKQTEKGFFAPLDIVDGMARIYHPIAEGINDPKTPYFGVFLKDYGVTPW